MYVLIFFSKSPSQMEKFHSRKYSINTYLKSLKSIANLMNIWKDPSILPPAQKLLYD